LESGDLAPFSLDDGADSRDVDLFSPEIVRDLETLNQSLEILFQSPAITEQTPRTSLQFLQTSIGDPETPNRSLETLLDLPG